MGYGAGLDQTDTPDPRRAMIDQTSTTKQPWKTPELKIEDGNGTANDSGFLDDGGDNEEYPDITSV